MYFGYVGDYSWTLNLKDCQERSYLPNPSATKCRRTPYILRNDRTALTVDTQLWTVGKAPL